MPPLSIVDSSGRGHVLTANGNAVISAQAAKFNGLSLKFPSTGTPYVSTPDSDDFVFSDKNFTIDMWVRFGSVAASRGFVSQVVDDNNLWQFGYDQSLGALVFYAVESSVDLADYRWSWSPSVDTWYHLAVVRTGTTMLCMVDGVVQSKTETTAIGTNTLSNLAAALDIGRFRRSAAYQYMDGWIDELRITRGRAIWSTHFVVPDAPVEVLADPTVFLVHGDAIKDVSRAQHTISNTDVTVDSGEAIVGDGSLSFNGTTAYLSAANSTDWDFGSDDFTIEGWVNLTRETADFETILTIDKNSNHQSENFLFDIYNNSSSIFRANLSDGSTQYVASATTDILDGAWHHFAAVRNGNNLLWYIDGVEEDTVDVTGVSVNFDASMVVNVGARITGAEPMQGYISEVRITKGEARYTEDFAPPIDVYPKPYARYDIPHDVDDETKLLLHGLAVRDYSRVRRTIGNTNVTLSSTQTKFFDTALSFNGSDSVLSLADSEDFNFDSGDFTIEFWMYPTDGTFRSFFSHATNSGNFQAAYTNVGGSLRWVAQISSSYIIDITSDSTVTPNVWTHVALVRHGSIQVMYVNGVAQADTDTHAGAMPNPTGSFFIGQDSASLGLDNYVGYMDQFRITKGTARYVGNFDVPDTYFPRARDQATKLLLHCAREPQRRNFFRDSSPSEHSVIPVADTKYGTTTKKFGDTSIYFDGTGDLIRIPYSSDWAFGSGDFTVECWFKTGTASCGLLARQSSDTVANESWFLRLDSSKLRFYLAGNTTQSISLLSASNFDDNAWHHAAAVRDGNTVRLFADGTIVDSDSFTYTVNSNTSEVTVGAMWFEHLSSYLAFMNGYIDEARITKGVARWVANFTPPSRPYPDYL